MASRKNLQELVSQLMTHVELASGTYKNDLVLKIVEMCSGEKYALVHDFGWYLNVLWALSHMRGIDVHAELLKHQVTDVALRVLPVRTYAVQKSMQVLVEKYKSIGGGDKDNGRGKQIMKEVLPAFAWIVGEYSDLIKNDEEEFKHDESAKGNYHALVQVLVSPSNIQKMPTTTQIVYVQAAMKVFAAATADQKVSQQELEACVGTLMRYLPVYMESLDVEVQERAYTANELLRSLNLCSSIGDVPGLAEASDDDESQYDNLLGITQATNKRNKSFGTSSSLVARCRGASETLNYILKPEAMKPTGAKAQRKKRQAPIGVDVDLIEAPIDLSVFSSFIEDELRQRPSAGTNISMESVIFTQQRPLQLSETETRPAGISMDINIMAGEMSTPSSSFQHMGEAAEGSGLGAHPQLNRQQQDPFYLDSGAPSEVEGNHPNRFGTIELSSSDGHESSGRNGRKKKKKRRKGQKEKSSVVLSDADFSMLGISAAPAIPQPTSTGLTNVTIYTSDDNEEEEDHPKRKNTSGKEFEGLAKVDLTIPLRKDEVMPERQHRVVPDRKPEEHSKRGSSKKHKKKEAKKHKKKNKEMTQESSGGGGVGDLLDLSGFMPVAEFSRAVVAASPKGPTGSSKSIGHINTVFDDLLSLSAPVPSAQLIPTAALSSSGTDLLGMNATATQTSSKPSKSKHVWMKATVKASRAEGSPVVDWTKINLRYRVHFKQDGTATVTFCVENQMDSSTLHNLQIKLKGQADIAIGNVDPHQLVESQKSGPISFVETSEVSVDFKGSLVLPEQCTVPFRMSVPVTHFLSPRVGLSQDDVMNELSFTQWASHSVKLTDIQSPAKAKAVLSSFLHAVEVEGASSPLMGTVASQSQAGSKVFCLIKIKDSTAKIDVKCNNPTLCKSIASDVKKLVL
jgi:AP-3 complex subunit delta-1